MGAGAIAAREGVYTTWTWQATYDFGAELNSNGGVVAKNDGKVVLMDWTNQLLIILSPAAAVLATLADYRPYGRGYDDSQFRRYMCFPDGARTDVVVQEGIAELWRRAVTLDRGAYVLAADPVQQISMSPSGEWIAIWIKESGNNTLLFIYKGSP